ncbi:hypothetical protein TGVAND_280590 [Toxoplasma gondii VAND]|uniref:Uncharacterized protein n=1 Tax=Toxoplasma gondii VAND TaxID=933077 RepID=A0A086PIH0_TOXGO|nr:hypothetical protein TGVAND_280590 [Toxoplasma gondii VAND]
MPPGGPPPSAMGLGPHAAASESGAASRPSGSSGAHPASRPSSEYNRTTPLPPSASGKLLPDQSSNPSTVAASDFSSQDGATPGSPVPRDASLSGEAGPLPSSSESERGDTANPVSGGVSESRCSADSAAPVSDKSRTDRGLSPVRDTATSGADPAAGREAAEAAGATGKAAGHADARKGRKDPASEDAGGTREPSAASAPPRGPAPQPPPVPKVAAALRKLGVSELPQISFDSAGGDGEGRGRSERRQRRTQAHTKGLFKRMQDGLGREVETPSQTTSGGGKRGGQGAGASQKQDSHKTPPADSGQATSRQWRARPGTSPAEGAAGMPGTSTHGGSGAAGGLPRASGLSPTAVFPAELGSQNSSAPMGAFAEQVANASSPSPLPFGRIEGPAGPGHPSGVPCGVGSSLKKEAGGQRHPKKGVSGAAQKRRNATGGTEGSDRGGEWRQPLPGQSLDAGRGGDGAHRPPVDSALASMVRDVRIEQFGPDGVEKNAENVMAISTWRVTWIDGSWKVHTAAFEPNPSRDPYPLAATEACAHFALRLHRMFRETYTQQGAATPPRFPPLGHLLGGGAVTGAPPGGPWDGVKPTKVWNMEEMQRLHQHVATVVFATVGPASASGSQFLGPGGPAPPRDPRHPGAYFYLHRASASPGAGTGLDGSVDPRAGSMSPSLASVSSTAPCTSSPAVPVGEGDGKLAFSPFQPSSLPGGPYSAGAARFPFLGGGPNPGVESQGFGFNMFPGTPTRGHGTLEHPAHAYTPQGMGVSSSQAVPGFAGGVFPGGSPVFEGGFQSPFYGAFSISGVAGDQRSLYAPVARAGVPEQMQGSQLSGRARAVDSGPSFFVPESNTLFHPGCSPTSAASRGTIASSLPSRVGGALDEAAGGSCRLHSAGSKSAKGFESLFPPCSRAKRSAVSVSATRRGGAPVWGVNSHVAAALAAAAARRTAEEQSLLEEARREAEREALLSKLLGEDDTFFESGLSMRSHRLFRATPRPAERGLIFKEKASLCEQIDQEASGGNEDEGREVRSDNSPHATRGREGDGQEENRPRSQAASTSEDNAGIAPTVHIKREAGQQGTARGRGDRGETPQTDRATEADLASRKDDMSPNDGEESKKPKTNRKLPSGREAEGERTDKRRRRPSHLLESGRASGAGEQQRDVVDAAGAEALSFDSEKRTSTVSVLLPSGKDEATETIPTVEEHPVPHAKDISRSFVFEPSNTGLIVVELSEKDEKGEVSEDEDALDVSLSGAAGASEDGKSPANQENLLPWEFPDKTRLLLQSVANQSADFSETCSFGADQRTRDAALIRDLEPFLRLGEQNPYFDARGTQKNILSGCMMSSSSLFNVWKIVNRLRLQDERRPEERDRLARVAQEQSQGARRRLGAVLNELAALEREDPNDVEGAEGDEGEGEQSGKEMKDAPETVDAKASHSSGDTLASPVAFLPAAAEGEAENGHEEPTNADPSAAKSGGSLLAQGEREKTREDLPDAFKGNDKLRSDMPQSTPIDGLPALGAACSPLELETKTPAILASGGEAHRCCPAGEGGEDRMPEDAKDRTRTGELESTSDRANLSTGSAQLKGASAAEKRLEGGAEAKQTLRDSNDGAEGSENDTNQLLPTQGGPQERTQNAPGSPLEGEQALSTVRRCGGGDKEREKEKDALIDTGERSPGIDERSSKTTAPELEKQVGDTVKGDRGRDETALAGTAESLSLGEEGTDQGEKAFGDMGEQLVSPPQGAGLSREEGNAKVFGDRSALQLTPVSCPPLTLSGEDGDKEKNAPALLSAFVKTEEGCATDIQGKEEGAKESPTPTPRGSPSTSARNMAPRGSAGERQDAKRLGKSYATRRAQKRKRLELLSSSCEEIEQRLRRLSDTFPWLPVLNEAFFSAESKGEVLTCVDTLLERSDEDAALKGGHGDPSFASRPCGGAGLLEAVGGGLKGPFRDAVFASEGEELEKMDESEDEEAALVPEDLWLARASALAEAKAEKRALADARSAAANACAAAAMAFSSYSPRPYSMEPFPQASRRPFVVPPPAMMPAGAEEAGAAVRVNSVQMHASPVPFSPFVGGRVSGMPDEADGGFAGTRRFSASTQSSRARGGAVLDAPHMDPAMAEHLQNRSSSASSRESLSTGGVATQGDVWAEGYLDGALSADTGSSAANAGWGSHLQGSAFRSGKRAGGSGADKGNFWSGRGPAETYPGELGSGAAWGSGAEMAGLDSSARGVRGSDSHGSGRRQKASGATGHAPSGDRTRRRSSVASSVTSSVSASRGGSGLPASGLRSDCAGSVHMTEGSDTGSQGPSRSASIIMGPPSPIRPSQYTPASAYPNSPAVSHASCHTSFQPQHAPREGGAERGASWQSLQHAAAGGTGNLEEGDALAGRSAPMGDPSSAGGGGRFRPTVGAMSAQMRGYPAHSFAAHGPGLGSTLPGLPSNYGKADGYPAGLTFPGTPASGTATPFQGGYPISDASFGGNASGACSMGYSSMPAPGYGPEMPQVPGRFANFSPFFRGEKGVSAGDRTPQLAAGTPSSPSTSGMQTGQSAPPLSPWFDHNNAVQHEAGDFGAREHMSSPQVSASCLGASQLAGSRQAYATIGGENINVPDSETEPLHGRGAATDTSTGAKGGSGARAGAASGGGEGKASRKRKPKSKKEGEGHSAVGDEVAPQHVLQETNACSSATGAAPLPVCPKQMVPLRGGEGEGHEQSPLPEVPESGGQTTCSPYSISPSSVSGGTGSGTEFGAGYAATVVLHGTPPTQRKTLADKKRRSKSVSDNRGTCGSSLISESDGAGKFMSATSAAAAATTPSRKKVPPAAASGGRK